MSEDYSVSGTSYSNNRRRADDNNSAKVVDDGSSISAVAPEKLAASESTSDPILSFNHFQDLSITTIPTTVTIFDCVSPDDDKLASPVAVGEMALPSTPPKLSCLESDGKMSSTDLRNNRKKNIRSHAESFKEDECSSSTTVTTVSKCSSDESVFGVPLVAGAAAPASVTILAAAVGNGAASTVDSKNAGSPTLKPQKRHRESRVSKSSSNPQSSSGPNILSQLKNFLAPNYKTRNEEFKRLFKVPETEKFIIDYSCAYQREILVHGRMYLSQNWLCFYANIFKWETMITLRFKDITKVTKERTAKVIPNAIQVCTKCDEKYFFTSFVTRDKTHMVLFRLWQSALLDQLEQPAELWAWAQHGYNEADLSESPHEDLDEADDEQSSVNENGGGKKLFDKRTSVSAANLPVSGPECANSSVEGGPQNQPPASSDMPARPCASASNLTGSSTDTKTDVTTTNLKHSLSVDPKTASHYANSLMLGLDAAIAASQGPGGSLSTPGDEYFTESSNEMDENVEIACSCVTHEGKEMLNEAFPISVDQLFLLLFTDSPFYRRLQEDRKTTNLECGEWHYDKASGLKLRQMSYNVALNHSFGPKTCGVIEKQICAQCSRTGKVYVVKCECQNIGIPYADSFYVVTTYCLSKISPSICRLRLHGGVAYRSKCWGIVKSFIDKNALVGVQDYFNDLSNHLRAECDKLGLRRESVELELKREKEKSLERGLTSSSLLAEGSRSNKSLSIVYPLIPTEIETLTKAILFVLILMLLLNAMLFYKLWKIEADWEQRSFESALWNLKDLLEKPELSSTEWMQLFHGERAFFKKKSTKWTENLQLTISSVERVENALKEIRQQMNNVRNEMAQYPCSDDKDDKNDLKHCPKIDTNLNEAIK